MVTTSTALVPRRVGIDVLFTLMYESTHGIEHGGRGKKTKLLHDEGMSTSLLMQLTMATDFICTL